jgi:hypothetical protein
MMINTGGRQVGLLALSFGLVTFALVPQARAQSSGCRPADAQIVPSRLTYFKDLLTSTVAARKAVRDSLGLAAVSASKVSLVTKASTCVGAVNALNTHRQEPGVTRQVWVYALGTNYAVEDSGIAAASGEYRPIYLFDRNFVYKRTLAGL